ncbi:NAD(P)H-dependent oxidoreductase [Mucilaginibacter achroorhodeus]|uniref:NAD(P)H-dependent oxidoreductase n=1 Tax=Mucilaginibacter achroorhodeus TaxID=2599294 RepID=A0A563UBG4_9SPHI|nr:NAD(P)H-dependent oxidoreductase [Mucilaginibacter achroorhodeus]TWR28684.1 NAD(P)H-dependent oxidoreductase [Mucilaginibacter achroorhodeus]
MTLVDKLNWRYATKKFDTDKKIPVDKLNYILEATKLSPSSFGLQHYRVIVVENPEVRAKLREAAYGQPQVTDASHLVVFAAETGIDEDFVKDYIDHVAEVRNVPRADLKGFEDTIVGTINSRTPEQLTTWAQKQAYIALGILIAAASEQGVDSGPMEGFDAAKFDEILGLKDKELTASVIVAIGYRADDDPYGKLVKVRRPEHELFIHI